MLFDVRCPNCGARCWSPCPRCVAQLRPPSAAQVHGAASVTALFAHEGVGRVLVHALKFHNDRTPVRWLARSLAATLAPRGVHLVTWAPTTASRRRGRGYDQGRVLARAVGREVGVRSPALLARRGTRPQSGAGRADRLQGPSFVARAPLGGARIAVVDDVLTTGATAAGAVAALRTAGAVEVHVVVCSRAGTSSGKSGP